jgi:hypothetical protein
MAADAPRAARKDTAVREPAARIAGETPALQCARKNGERGRPARIVYYRRTITSRTWND